MKGNLQAFIEPGYLLVDDHLRFRTRSSPHGKEHLPLYVDQWLSWRVHEPWVRTYVKKVASDGLALDIGCGNGIVGIMAEKVTQMKVRCIDQDRHAIELAQQNVRQNHAHRVQLDNLIYYEGTLRAEEKARLIFLNPNSLLYPAAGEICIPYANRAGRDGLSEFTEQMVSALTDLADDGLIFFMMEGLGDAKTPLFRKKLTSILPGSHGIVAAPLIEPLNSKYFYNEIFDERVAYYINYLHHPSQGKYFHCQAGVIGQRHLLNHLKISPSDISPHLKPADVKKILSHQYRNLLPPSHISPLTDHSAT